ncbi:MAG TPA: hypothetical protein VGI39_10580 [Polyangiaceae bacterium]|jgi:sugar/nucleoside kinase (ribokinase family)
MSRPTQLSRAHERQTFDVICAGEALWRGAGVVRDLAAREASAAVFEIARLLARAEARVGVAAVIDDDRRGRSTLAELTALRVEVGGVKLAPPGANLIVVDAVGGQAGIVADQRPRTPFEVPHAWVSQVLVLSGLSPVTSKAAAVCKAARRARREGAAVVLDVAGSLREWVGHDARTIAMVLREADVVRCSFVDLAVLGTDTARVRGSMREGAILVLHDAHGAVAMGRFGEVHVEAREMDRERAGEVCAATIGFELARPRGGLESEEARWHRVLREVASRVGAS